MIVCKSPAEIERMRAANQLVAAVLTDLCAAVQPGLAAQTPAADPATNGVAIDVQGKTDSILLSRNQIRESRMPMKRIGIRLGAESGKVELVDNKIEGLAVAVADLRKA